MMELRKSEDRGHANHGWLDTYHSFSFGDYYDPRYLSFSALRVINEDYIDADSGFGMHSHRDMEIITYVLEGELTHQDSLGNGSVIHPGNVQRMSAGTGVRHSEFNSAHTQRTHLLQIWIEPNVVGIDPGYEEKHFDAQEKRGQLRLIASADGHHGSVRIHQEASIYAGLFDAGERAEIALAPGRRGYVHVARGMLHVNGLSLRAGDALKVVDEMRIELAHGQGAEVLLFDLP